MTLTLCPKVCLEQALHASSLRKRLEDANAMQEFIVEGYTAGHWVLKTP